MSRVIAFAQQKGGSGKTTLLSQVAAELKTAKTSVAVIDLDPQRSLTGWMELRAENPALPALDLIESSEFRIGADMRAARKTHDWVLADCPGNADILLARAMREADLVVAPVQPSAADIWAFRATLAQANKEKTPCRVVLNRAPARGALADEAAARLKEEGASLFRARIGARVAFAQAFMRGAGVTEVAARSKAADEVRALTREIRRTKS